MSRLDLASLREGDVIESTQTLQVSFIGSLDGYVEAKDVQSGQTYGFQPKDVDGSRTSRKLVMVKRAVRKPKVGDVITGSELNAISWDKGTVVQSLTSGNTYLKTCSKWACDDGIIYQTSAESESQFEILHVA